MNFVSENETTSEHLLTGIITVCLKYSKYLFSQCVNCYALMCSAAYLVNIS